MKAIPSAVVATALIAAFGAAGPAAQAVGADVRAWVVLDCAAPDDISVAVVNSGTGSARVTAQLDGVGDALVRVNLDAGASESIGLGARADGLYQVRVSISGGGDILTQSVEVDCVDDAPAPSAPAPSAPAATATPSPAPTPAAPQVFTVTTTANAGAGSLRQAILNANGTTATDSIVFAVGSGRITIAPTSPLPAITSPVNLDAGTQPGTSGTPLVELVGSAAGSGPGLRVTAAGGGSTVRGFAVTRFPEQGILVDASNTVVAGNYVGLTGNGIVGPNGGDGITVVSGGAATPATGNRIGGTITGDGNIVSANRGNGIAVLAQDGGDAGGTVVQGNVVGTDPTGVAARPNAGSGVLVAVVRGQGDARGVTVGGTTGTGPGLSCAGACNLVSGNIGNGIELRGAGVTAAAVRGNIVGLDLSGAVAVANGGDGIELNGAPGNTVGGSSAAERNVVSGNTGAGVLLTGAAATGNTVSGNFIGTDTTGLKRRGNAGGGVVIAATAGAAGARDDVIGGAATGATCAGACNVISGNGGNGILIAGTDSGGHVIAGNAIGVGVDRSTPLGNASDGIGIAQASNVRVGGAATGEGNTIAANGANGVVVVGGASSGVRIQGNAVGLTAAGTIAGNTAAGVAVVQARHVAVLENAVAGNGGLGIDLGGTGRPLANDPGDADGGANGGQNTPTVLAADTRDGVTTIGGQYSGAALTSVRLEFFESAGCNGGAPVDYGEGATYLGAASIRTDVYGNTAWGFTSPRAVAGNRYITATATSVVGGAADETSGFSQCIIVNAAKPALTDGAGWYLKQGLTTGGADLTFGYGFPTAALLCAWDPVQPGVELPVVYANGTWFFRASYTTGTADLMVSYGGPGLRPVCGDWDGDGVDTIGVVGADGTFLVRDSNDAGAPSARIAVTGTGRPVVGDWNGDGRDGVGLSDGARWRLVDAGGSPSYDISWGGGGIPVVGDWDGDGDDTLGLYDGGAWIVRNALSGGPIDGVFRFGFPGAQPLTW